MKLLLMSLMLFGIFSAANTVALPPSIPQGDYVVILNTKDFSSGSSFSNDTLHISVFKPDKTNDVLSEKLINGSTFIYLNNGTYDLLFYLDDPTTEAVDYIGWKHMVVTSDINTNIALQRSGSLKVTIVSPDSSDPIVRINSIDCINSAYSVIQLNPVLSELLPNEFFVKYIPEGDCTLELEINGVRVTKQVSIEQGKITQLTLQAPNNQFNFDFTTVLMLAVIIIAVTSIAYFLLYKNKKEKLKTDFKPEISSHEIKKTDGMANVLNALDEKEASVSELLLKCGGKMKQSRIARELLLPKATLSRLVQSLEARNIVEVISYGRTNMVRLTKWFKGL